VAVTLDATLDGLLPSLLEAYGPPGRETGVRSVIRRAVRGLGTVTEEPTGNLRLHRPGRGPRLLLVAAMDAPGVILTRVDSSGLGRVSLIGSGRSPAELIGATIRFEDGRHGLLGADRPKAAKDGAELEADQLFFETGLPPKEAVRSFPVGSVGAVQDRPAKLGDLWCAANLDNRAGCAAVIAALRSARAGGYDLHVLFSAQSDPAARGALTGAFGVDPEMAVAVEVAHVDPRETAGIAVGKGPALCLKEEGFVAHPEALALAKRAALAARVKTQWLIRETEGSDARSIRAARAGVPTALIAIPARRTGGPLSLAHRRDIAQTAALVAKLVTLGTAKRKGGSR
jgi:putative aminopeptidase FrvX